MEQIEVTAQLISKAVASALGKFVGRLDHDALVRYAHPDQHSLTQQALQEVKEALAEALEDHPDWRKEVGLELYLTKDRARALAQLVKRLDHDALVRYAHADQKHLTEQALTELRTALANAGFNPR